jgi:ankyrin repeat protein
MAKPTKQPELTQLSAELYDAVTEGNIEHIKALLRAGADPNPPIDSDGTTILMEASDAGCIFSQHRGHVHFW